MAAASQAPGVCEKSHDVTTVHQRGAALCSPLPSAGTRRSFLLASPWLSPSGFLEAVLYVAKMGARREEAPATGLPWQRGASALWFLQEKLEKVLDREDKDERGNEASLAPLGWCREKTEANRRGSRRSQRDEWGAPRASV